MLLVQIKEVLKTVLFVALFGLLLFSLRQYVFTPVIVKGDSMDPTLHDGERVIAMKTPKSAGLISSHLKPLMRWEKTTLSV